MNEFNKWLNKSHPYRIDWKHYEAELLAEEAWKAALEWTLSIAQEDSFDFLHHWEKGVSEEDKKIISPRGIKKELEGE